MSEGFEHRTADGHRLEGTLEELGRLAVALLHAASDMAQAKAACDMLEEETEDHVRARALETAIAVCYARAFTVSNLRTLSSRAFGPKKGTDQRVLHDALLQLRKKVYAHTDVESGRSIGDITINFGERGDIAHVTHRESWHPLDRQLLDSIRELCESQHSRFGLEGTRLALALAKARQGHSGEGPAGS
jgi:hypothetical protein